MTKTEDEMGGVFFFPFAMFILDLAVLFLLCKIVTVDTVNVIENRSALK